MSTIPSQDTIVTAAVAALRAFGGNLNERTARRLLAMWRHYDLLSAEQVTQVVATFGGAR